METTKVRMFYARDCDGADKDVMVTNKSDSSLEIRETALEDDVIDNIVDLLSKGSIKSIHLEECSANLNDSVFRLVEAMGNCRDVRLSESTFLAKHFLEAFLESATKLKSLRIRDHLLVEQIEALSRGLASNKILHTLDLSRSRFDDFSILAEGLGDGCAKKLKLRSIGLRDNNLATLIAALESSPSSSSEDITDNDIEAETALESLDLSFNRLRNLECIGEFLRCRDCNLRELLIGYQNLWQPNRNGTNIDVSGIATALHVNPRLTTLKLPRNELNDSDALLFASALEENSTLETLDLRENNIADTGVISLAVAARSSRGLLNLHLRGNPFGTGASLALLEAASENYRLAFIDGDNGKEEDECINRQIRYQTALNRAGRKLLLLKEPPPLALWPCVFEKQASCFDREETDDQQRPSSDNSVDMRTDIIYYLLKQCSTTFFSSQRVGESN